MAFGPIATVKVNVGLAYEPVRTPFASTTPLGSVIRTGPVTDALVWVSVHVISAVWPCSGRAPTQVPVSGAGGGVGEATDDWTQAVALSSATAAWTNRRA